MFESRVLRRILGPKGTSNREMEKNYIMRRLEASTHHQLIFE